MNKIIFLLTFFILNSCSIHDFNSNLIFNEIYDKPKIKFLEPSPNILIQDDVIPLSFQISHPMGIKYANITYADQEKKYSYDNIQYPTTVTINEHLAVTNNGAAIVSICAVTGKNTELMTNINYDVMVASTYFTTDHPKTTALLTTYIEITFLSTSAEAKQVEVVGPLGTQGITAGPSGFGAKLTVSNLRLNLGYNDFTLRVTSKYGRMTFYKFTVRRI